MKLVSALASLASALSLVSAYPTDGFVRYPGMEMIPEDQTGLALNGVPWADRVHWMRVANNVVRMVYGKPCSYGYFGAVVVNTTSNEVVCYGYNNIGTSGIPYMHGEMNALTQCTQVLSDRGLSASEISAAWQELSLYTNGEPCTMCSSALRWAGMGEVIWASTVELIAEQGITQIFLPSYLIVQASADLGTATNWYGHVLTNETDPMYMFQNNETYACPDGCERTTATGSRTSSCTTKASWEKKWNETNAAEVWQKYITGGGTFNEALFDLDKIESLKV